MSIFNFKNKAPWQTSVAAFLSGQAVSILGSGLVQFALIWYVTYRTNSGSSMMLITLASFVPQLIVALFAGVWADKYDRRWLIILADGGIALSTLAVAVLLIYGYDNIWLIYAVSAVRSLGGGIQGPAITAIIPQMVPKKQLVRVNGIYTTINNAIQLLSPVMGGALLVALPLWGVFMIDVATAAVGISIMLCIPVPDKNDGKVYNAFGKRYSSYFSPENDNAQSNSENETSPLSEEKAEEQSSLKAFREGFAYVKTKPFITRLMMVYAGYMILLAPVATLINLYLRRNFGKDVWYFTAVQTALFSGMAIGGFIVSFKGNFKSHINVIKMSGILMATLTFTLATIGILKLPYFVVCAALALGYGCIVPFYTTSVTVLLQGNVDPLFHGRVFSLLYMIGSAAIPLGTAIFGPFADIMRVEYIYYGASLLQVLIIALSWNKFPKGL